MTRSDGSPRRERPIKEVVMQAFVTADAKELAINEEEEEEEEDAKARIARRLIETRPDQPPPASETHAAETVRAEARKALKRPPR